MVNELIDKLCLSLFQAQDASTWSCVLLTSVLLTCGTMTAVKDVDVELSADQKRAVIHFSHLSYDDFGRTGKWTKY